MPKVFLILISIFLFYVAYKYFLESRGASKGAIAPEIKTELVNGTPFDLATLRGKYVVLDFWGSWCGPCRTVIPELIKLQKDNRGQFEIVSVALEKQKGAGQNAAKLLGFNWTRQIEEVDAFVALNGIARNYGVVSIPTTFLISPEGKILGRMSVSQIRLELKMN